MSSDLPTQLPAHVDNVPLALKGQHVNHKRTTAWISPTPRASNTKIRTLPSRPPVFAHYLRTNPRTLENCEHGRAKPNAQAALLIHLVDRYLDTVKRLLAV